MCQNLHLVCEAIGGGTCAVGAYDEEKLEKVLGVDSEQEITIYVAPAAERVKSPAKLHPENQSQAR